MQLVAAGFCYDAHLTAAELPVLGIEVAGDDAKLRNGIEVGNNCGARVYVFLRVTAIHAEVVRSFPLPVDGDVPGIERTRGIEDGRSYVLHGARAE